MVLHLPLPFDWRQPWLWPSPAKRVWWCLAFCVGVCVASPGWLARWQAWAEAQALADKVVQQQDETRMHQQRIGDLKQQQTQEASHLAQMSGSAGHAETVTHAWMASAQAHQLQVSQLSFDALQQPAALRALSLQHLPVHAHIQGSGKGWLNWWAKSPTWAPGATVSSLDVKAGSAGRVAVQLTLLLPQDAQPMPMPRDWTLASAASSPGEAPADPFSADHWTDLQLRHAQQHPSFATWVEPERHRVREPLEAFVRERLRYVGWVSQGAGVQALVQVREEVSPNANSKATPRLGDTVYRVGAGSYLGQDWGRISNVTPEHVHVRELVRNPEGVWSARYVVLPLEGGGP